MKSRRYLRFLALGLALGVTIPPTAHALAPHQVLLLVNENSPDSMRVAHHYAHLRDIPQGNVVYLDLPDEIRRPESEMGYVDFLDRIYDPAQAEVRKRGLKDQILAWVYSVDFPVRILSSGKPEISIQGATYLRGDVVPSAESIKQGTYFSRFFRGPNGPDGPMAATATFDALTNALGDELGLPSMMLGFTGSLGMSGDEVIQMLDRGFAADGTRPSAGVYFVTNNNVRSTCRAWQFSRAVKMLEETPIDAKIMGGFPKSSDNLFGIMSGAAAVNTSAYRDAFIPGAMAEHLTSWAATFHARDQTKVTEWLRAGAVGSAGTVTEPHAIWTKFPNAYFYVHYARGCSMMESLWLATYCPLQILFVGDPLATPYLPDLQVDLRALDSTGNTLRFETVVHPGYKQEHWRTDYYLDGRLLKAAAGSRLELDASDLMDGYHELRSHVMLGKAVVFHAHDTEELVLDREGARVALSGLEDGALVDPRDVLALELSATEGCRQLGLLCDGHTVASFKRTGSEEVTLRGSELGLGRHRLQTFGVFKGREPVYGSPLEINVGLRADRAPMHVELEEKKEENGVLLKARGEGPLAWFECWDPESEPRPYALTSARIKLREGRFSLAPDGDVPYGTCVIEGEDFVGEEIACETMTVNHVSRYNPQVIFGFRRVGDFGFFGIWGDRSAVVLGEYKNGKQLRKVVRGYPFRPNTWYELSVRKTADGYAEGRVNGIVVVRWKMPRSRWNGRAGLYTSGLPSVFGHIKLGLPASGEDPALTRESTVFIGHPDRTRSRTYGVRVDDGYETAEKQVTLGGEKQ